MLEEVEYLVEVWICCYAYSALVFIKNPTEIRTGLVCRSSVIQDIRLPFGVIRKLTICLIPSGHLNVLTECLEELYRYGIALNSFLRILRVHVTPIPVPHQCQAVETRRKVSCFSHVSKCWHHSSRGHICPSSYFSSKGHLRLPNTQHVCPMFVPKWLHSFLTDHHEW